MAAWPGHAPARLPCGGLARTCLTRMRILVLEDEVIQRTLLASWIRSDGHAVRCASNGAEAIHALQQEPFDVALLDWVVPRLSGLEVLLWARRRRPSLPVV